LCAPGPFVEAFVSDLLYTLVHLGTYTGGTGRIGWLAHILGAEKTDLLLQEGRSFMPAGAEHMRFPVSAMLAVCCAAAALAGCGSGGGPDVLAAPIRVVRTSAGTVAYRELGSGPALLLITGAGASMDYWPPSFVDGLAAHHEVVVFDNAGVGRTSAVLAPALLSITAMARQTSALISALRLHRPAVLGWSMGGMIAQALAVSYPALVSRLILAATAVGTGKAVPLPPYTFTVFSLSYAKQAAVLFPANQAAAARAFLDAVGQYPGFYGASAATIHIQDLAVHQWLAGQDAAGRLVGDIRVPTLVAGGTRDQFMPVANDRLLASSVPGAKLLLFDDAGHAFWFQDAARFIRAVDTFTG
jgi:pimeloyl-ACP methyl ester carboxylesterase